jgi:hypothetical protein
MAGFAATAESGDGMRVRMIRPAYWTDADLHTRLTADVREFYIGLWMLADDAGYVSFDVTRIGAELFPFRSNAWRSKRIPEWIQVLSPHVQLLECGIHLVVPSLPKYQHCPKPSYPNQRAHDACMRHMAPRGATGYHGGLSDEHAHVRKPLPPHGATGDPVVPCGTSTGREGKGRELEGGARRANGSIEEGTTEFERLVARPA